MNIAVDLHGTIDNDPTYFNSLFEEWRKIGHAVWIMSGPPKHIIQKELDDLGIKKYHGVISVVDFLRDVGVEMWHKPHSEHPNDWWCEEDDWWGAKARMCDALSVDIIIDNESKYIKGFKERGLKTIFMLYNDNHFIL